MIIASVLPLTNTSRSDSGSESEQESRKFVPKYGIPQWDDAACPEARELKKQFRAWKRSAKFVSGGNDYAQHYSYE